MWGAIGAKWIALGREQYGHPINDESVCPDGRGRFNHLRTMQVAGRPEASIVLIDHGTALNPVRG